MWCFLQNATPLHVELHLICRIACALLPCHASLNRTCIILGCASCHVHVLFVYHVVCFFPVLLLRVGSDNVAFVRIRSTTSVCLLHGLVLLPCGISGKMIIPSKSLLSLLARLLALLLCQCYDAYLLLVSLPICHVEPLTHLVLANR